MIQRDFVGLMCTIGRRPRLWCVLTALLGLCVALNACVVAPRYNSLDIALLPCEEGSGSVFFTPIEFDGEGAPMHPKQVEDLEQRLEDRSRPVRDLVFFVHGWNKNPTSAELDYQNFLCRLHAQLRREIGQARKESNLAVVGVFWPSTITNRAKEPLLVKPLSYYRIRHRAELVAETGLAELFESLTPRLERLRRAESVRIHLIGHSFGGRMLVRALETLDSDGELVPLLEAASQVNVVLIDAAMPTDRFDWVADAVTRSKGKGVSARFTEETASYLFNVHSFNDRANRTLFKLASLFNSDPVACAAGACGVPGYPTVCVDDSGELWWSGQTPGPTSERFNAWNVDATRIVFDHSDIYKGRVASMVATLLYDEQARRGLPGAVTQTSCADGKGSR